MGKLALEQFRQMHEEAKQKLERKKGRSLTSSDKTPRKKRASSHLLYDPHLAEKGCEGCPLNKAKLNSPKIPPSGAKHPLVYIIGEAPGQEEDEQNEQFVGKSGRVLREALPPSYRKITRFNNVIRCRPPENRAPTPLEVACCRAQNERDIEASKPAIVVGTGGIPLSWMLSRVGLPVSTITAWRGRKIPCRIGEHEFWYAPVLHPSYVMRIEHAKGGKEIVNAFKRDLQNAYELEDEPKTWDPDDVDKGLEFVPCDINVLKRVADEIITWSDFGVDIETNGIRPFFDKPKILTIAFSNFDKTYALPLQHREATWTEAELNQIYKKILPRIFKAKGKRIAHSSKFEQEWLLAKCGDEIVYDVQWEDTMAQAYTLDERGAGTKGLDALTTLYFGFNIKSFSSLDVTQLDDYPLPDVLRYNSHDAKYTYALFYLQQEELQKGKLIKVYRMHNERASTAVLAQSRGVLPNVPMIAKYDKSLSSKIEKIKAEIAEDEDVVTFVEKGKVFSPTSPSNVLDFMKWVVPKKDKNKITSTGEEILSEIDHPVAKQILELRKYAKQHGTYIVPYLPGGKQIWADGLIHTNFNHLKLVTGRWSSEDPNLQNFPKRKGKEIRDVVRAPDGHVIGSLDYGQIEARVIGMASKDTFLCKALWEKYDIHTEWTEKISRAYPSIVGGKKNFGNKEVMKKFRDRIKNEWTFPLFFGSVLSSVSSSLEIEESILEPLYDEFWETFSDVLNWQEDLIKFYRKHHYVETLTGRRRHAPMGYNEIINTPVQGTASDIVVDASVRLSRRAWKEQKPQYQFRINVHDDLTFYLPEKTLEEDIEIIAKDMLSCPYKFITVPLTVEVSVGNTWGKMEEITVMSSTDFK